MKLSVLPFTLDKNTWCYEEKGGLLIYHEDRTKEGLYIQTCIFKIPLKKIKDYIKRSEVKK
jgi:hypothetical protein